VVHPEDEVVDLVRTEAVRMMIEMEKEAESSFHPVIRLKTNKIRKQSTQMLEKNMLGSER